MATLFFLGLACWIATVIVTESELTRPARDWIATRTEHATVAGRRSKRVWQRLCYLAGCHLCTGTWVAGLLALFVPPAVSGGVVGWLVTALIIKAVGHAVFVLHKLGEAGRGYWEAEPTESDAAVDERVERWQPPEYRSMSYMAQAANDDFWRTIRRDRLQWSAHTGRHRESPE
jgi:hypothetical protein